MTNTVDALLVKREGLVKQLAKLDLAIAQAGFVDSLVSGAYVYGKLNDGTAFSHARLLGKTEAEGTSGVWYKLRLNEDTPEEIVKSVRLSNIDGVEGAEPTNTTPPAEPATPEQEAAVEAVASKGKKEVKDLEI